MSPFDPLFRNPHLATLAGNFWRRPISEDRWPAEAVVYQTEPTVRVLVRSQKPSGRAKGALVLVHGLEGSSESGYARSMVHGALQRGWATHRFNMRGCGGTEDLTISGYHAGQTSDLLAVIRELRDAGVWPIFVVGYSLGGNVALKLTGELGEAAQGLFAGVCAVSTPIDLAACVEALALPRNFIYENRFLNRLKARIRRRHLQAPEIYTLEHLPKIHSIADFDDHYTARLFGFGTAANYFRTQSSNQFLERIRVPTLLIQAKDDPLIPFSTYHHPAFAQNPKLTLQTPDYGGHLGFLSRRKPRFWLDETLLEWMEGNISPPDHVS
ncbi:MAG: YheT family hydrolase [Bryobacteraceae bacterium]